MDYKIKVATALKKTIVPFLVLFFFASLSVFAQDSSQW